MAHTYLHVIPPLPTVLVYYYYYSLSDMVIHFYSCATTAQGVADA